MLARAVGLATVPAALLWYGSGASAGTPAPSLEALVRASERIVVGRIRIGKSVEEVLNLNPEGDPARIVCTYIEVAASEHLKGEPTDSLTVRLLGGYAAGYAVIDADAPPVVDGEQVMLFLAQSDTPRLDSGAPAFYLPYARYGKVRVVEQSGQRLAVLPTSAAAFGLVPQPGSANVVAYDRLRALVEAQVALEERD
ncbi:MAG: hypothetical protein AB1505_05695 [Candidatus Latescibacterota bacterium]